MKDLLTTIELIIIARFIWKAARFIMTGKRSRKKSLIGKVFLLISRQLHSSIDSKIEKQNKRLADCSQQANTNVIQFKQYKRKLN